MDMTVPEKYATYMINMNFAEYCDEYNYNIFNQKLWDEDQARGHRLAWRTNPFDPSKNIYEEKPLLPKDHRIYNEMKYGKKQIRNMYDARMRPTNLYIRFLEDEKKRIIRLHKKILNVKGIENDEINSNNC